MDLIIDNRIRLRKSELPRGALTKIKEAFRYNNPAFFRTKAMGYYTGNIPRVIGTFRVDDEGTWVSLPRGGLKKLLKILEKFEIEISIADQRSEGDPVDLKLNSEITLRPYQEEAIKAILQAETCLIEGAPASGKTEILLASIAAVGRRAGVLVHDRNLFKQWVKRIETRLQIPPKEIGWVGLGKFKLGSRITVMMQQTARNKIDLWKDHFDFLGADECHRYAAKTFLETADACSARYRVGVSAGVKRRDLKHFLIHDLFGEIVFSIGREELTQLGFTTDIEIHIVHTKFEYDYNNEAALRDHFDDTFTDYDDLTVKEKSNATEKLGMDPKGYGQYLAASMADSDRNNLIYEWVRREYDRGSTSIIFAKRREHCKIWKDRLNKIGLECAIFWGAEGKKKEEKRIEKDLQRLKAKDVRIAIGTVLDEGIDMPAVDAGFITYRNAGNPGQLEQQAGRLARLFVGKDIGRLYYFHDIAVDAFSKDPKMLHKRFNKVVTHVETKKRKKIRSKK